MVHRGDLRSGGDHLLPLIKESEWTDVCKCIGLRDRHSVVCMIYTIMSVASWHRLFRFSWELGITQVFISILTGYGYERSATLPEWVLVTLCTSSGRCRKRTEVILTQRERATTLFSKLEYLRARLDTPPRCARNVGTTAWTHSRACAGQSPRTMPE